MDCNKCCYLQPSPASFILYASSSAQYKLISGWMGWKYCKNGKTQNGNLIPLLHLWCLSSVNSVTTEAGACRSLCIFIHLSIINTTLSTFHCCQSGATSQWNIKPPAVPITAPLCKYINCTAFERVIISQRVKRTDMQSIIIHVPTQQSVKFPVNMFVWGDDGIKILTVLFVRANSSKWIWIYWLFEFIVFCRCCLWTSS